MMLTIKKKGFIDELPEIVEDAIKTYGIRLRKIEIEEDEKGCYTILITYDSEFRP
ncbi:hypothetical protein [Thermococcus sp.]|uniref:hypothetical protein n=1 Tax=Thermococcus sp. TaxID=35749 RepID=UPI00263699EC|nr:hypothetical protein [Thermococcus sp.]